MSTLEVRYESYGIFDLPEGVILLKPSANIASAEGTPFSWWIKWKTLNYYDKDGVLQEVESRDGCSDFKRHIECSENYIIEDDNKENEQWGGGD
jgi:hypothetical protein